jgi:hypothetical protein
MPCLLISQFRRNRPHQRQSFSGLAMGLALPVAVAAAPPHAPCLGRMGRVDARRQTLLFLNTVSCISPRPVLDTP